MLLWTPWKLSANYPVLSLITCFVIWKALLAALVLACPSPGYDTSTDLLRSKHGNSTSNTDNFKAPLGKFVRWDAIYFTQISHRGILFEQEWAFGWGFTKLLAFVAKAFAQFQNLGLLDAEALAGVSLSHVFHLLSSLVLYQLSLNIFHAKTKLDRTHFALLAASLHIISPAGIFLSAPYSESPFSFFNFTGFYLYSKSLNEDSRGRSRQRDLFLLSSGLFFGLATTLRSNGLLSGSLFFFEIFRDLLNFRHPSNVGAKIHRLCIAVIAGSVMACCAVLPQLIAYSDYCITINEDQIKRPWCSSRVPSVYVWVQAHYWQVGFFKYWTMPNIPLFVLAAPMLCIMSLSVLEAWKLDDIGFIQTAGKRREKLQDFRAKAELNQGIVQRLAIPQGILTVLALTNYHVQIISRLSSGYPVWYWWLTSKMIDNSELKWRGTRWNFGRVIVRWMILYALIQGGLFASFLPPA